MLKTTTLSTNHAKNLVTFFFFFSDDVNETYLLLYIIICARFQLIFRIPADDEEELLSN